MGQGGVGKTAMVLRFTTGDFNEQVRRRIAANSRQTQELKCWLVRSHSMRIATDVLPNTSAVYAHHWRHVH